MDIREEISLSKRDTLRKSSSLPDSDQNKHRNKLVGFKDKPWVGRVSPKKSKLVSEFNPITGVQVVNTPIDVVVADNAKLDKDDVVKKSAVADKDDVVKKPVVADKAPTTVVVSDKALATDNDKGSLSVDVVPDDIVLNKASVVVKQKPVKVNENSAVNVGKAPVKDKALVKDKVEVSVLKSSLSVDVVPDDMVLNKSAGNAVLSKDKLKQKVIPTVQGLSEVSVLRSSNQKDKPKVKYKVPVHVSRSKETHVKRKRNLLKENENKKEVKVKLLKGKSKKEDFDSELETDDVGSSFDEVDRKPNKLKLKGGLKRKRNVSDSDSSALDDEKIRTSPSSLFSAIGNSRVDMLNFLEEIALKDIQVNDIASKLVGAQEVNFIFEVNFLTLFTNTMGMSYGLKGHICLDVVRRLREDCVITDIDWCGYIYDCLKDNKLLTGTNHYLGPLAFLFLLYLDSTKFNRFSVVRTRPTIRKWSSYSMKQRQELELNDRVLGLLELHGEWTEAVGQETEGFTVILFKEPISFNDDDGNGDDDTGNGDDDGNRDDDVGVDNDVNEDDDDNGDGNDSSVNDKEVHVEDDGNRVVDGNGDGHDDNGGSKKHVESTGKQSVDPTDPTGEEIDEYLYGHALDAINEYFLRMEESDAGPVTPDRLATRVSKLSPSREKRMVKPSPYLLSPYMNKKTKVLPKITRLVVESKLQCDMLRRLRFKYATKILLHEINVHAPKMLELAKEFD
ncbi:hypothetical protein Tco_0369430 [Tanacetum coccineum]